MRTIEIPREAWVQQLNEFSVVHDGWLVSLEVMGPEIGAQPEITNLPLLGVSADRIDRDATMTVSVARSSTDHVTHVVHAVTRIDLERTDEGADAALEIKSSDGTTTLLQLRVAALPETVDGVIRHGVTRSR
jgi:Family of unknown function (DUF5335)